MGSPASRKVYLQSVQRYIAVTISIRSARGSQALGRDGKWEMEDEVENG